MNKRICLILRTFIETYKNRNVQVQSNEYCLEKQVFIRYKNFMNKVILRLPLKREKSTKIFEISIKKLQNVLTKTIVCFF